MVFNRLIETFTVEGTKLTEKQRYDFRVAGITILMWGSFLFMLDSTIVGLLVSTLPGLKKDYNNTLDFSIIKPKTTVILGEQGTSVVDEQGTSGVGEQEISVEDKQETLSEKFKNNIISIISLILILLGMALIFVSYSRQNAAWVMPVCALFYTFAFVYLISFFRHIDDIGNNKYRYLGISCTLILAGGLIQGLVKDEVVELPEETTPATTTATTKAN